MKNPANFDSKDVDRMKDLMRQALAHLDLLLPMLPAFEKKAAEQGPGAVVVLFATYGEHAVRTLARYNGKIVPHRVISASGSIQQGEPLVQGYVCAMLKICSGVSGFSVTCMGDNNWITDHRFRIDELMALLIATPVQRCLGCLAAMGVDLEKEFPG